MPESLNNAGVFLINSLFDLYIFVLVIRLILVKMRADYFNPLSQFIVKITQPVITPLRRIFPNVAHIELASLVLIFLLEIIKFYLIGLIMTGLPHITGVLILAIADILKTLLNTFFYAILMQIILSWVQPGYSPMGRVLSLITSPIMRPIQRIIPPIGGMDISPIPALLGIQCLIILLVTPLFNMGLRLSFG
jgi:YggT family protein